MPLQLPISPADALRRIVEPASQLLPYISWDDRALVMLLAVALQESGLAARVQAGGGPARGLWQFERGGVQSVLTHRASAAMARELCAARACPVDEYSVWASLAGDDVLACGVARLLLWTDPAPLPAVSDAAGAWRYYERLWRPGRPRPERWPANHAAAVAAVCHDEIDQ